MKKPLLFIVLTALMLSVFSLGYALTVQVGETTETVIHFPIYTLYGYN